MGFCQQNVVPCYVLAAYMCSLFYGRMVLKNAGNYVVAMDIFVLADFQNYLQFMSLLVHMKETTL